MNKRNFDFDLSIFSIIYKSTIKKCTNCKFNMNKTGLCIKELVVNIDNDLLNQLEKEFRKNNKEFPKNKEELIKVLVQISENNKKISVF